jgi:hypothetical protein
VVQAAQVLMLCDLQTPVPKLVVQVAQDCHLALLVQQLIMPVVAVAELTVVPSLEAQAVLEAAAQVVILQAAHRVL